MKKKDGRKGFGQELKIVERYSALTEPFFKVLTEMLVSEEKTDRKWAVEQLGKAYIKMIPQTLAGYPDNPIGFGVIMYPNGKEKNSVETTQKTGDSK